MRRREPKKVKKNAHLWERDPDDFYVESEDCSEALFRTVEFLAAPPLYGHSPGEALPRNQVVILDPSCGTGRVVRAARAAGYTAYGADIAPRWRAFEGRADHYGVADFLSAEQYGAVAPHWIISNPPFKHCAMGPHDPPPPYVVKALEVATVGVALLLPLNWIAGENRADWQEKAGLAQVLPIVPRPSMPPGAVILAGVSPGNGEKSFAWYIFRHGHKGPWTGGWCRRHQNVSCET